MRFFGRRNTGLRDEDMPLIPQVIPGWQLMSEGEQSQLVADTDRLLRTKRWEASRGFSLTEQMKVHVAAQAALLLIGLDLDAYHRVGSIIIHPRDIVSDQVRSGPVPGVVSSGPLRIQGETAHGTGPVVITWSAVRMNTRHPERSQNVVFHEFAHKIDMLDNALDGNPPMADADQLKHWERVCADTFERVRRGTSSGALRNYAASNRGEFFAVATETFFTMPVALLVGEPELYGVLKDFYQQDPVSRVEVTVEE